MEEYKALKVTLLNLGCITIGFSCGDEGVNEAQGIGDSVAVLANC